MFIDVIGNTNCCFHVGVHGALPPRLAHDMVWNSTINLSGGENANMGADYVNELLNRQFKGMFSMLY